MSYEQDAARLAAQMAELAGDVRAKQQRTASDVNGMERWWKGEASQAFKRAYHGADQDVRKLRDHLSRTSSSLKQLERAIRRADEERRREAAREAARQAAAKKG